MARSSLRYYLLPFIFAVMHLPTAQAQITDVNNTTSTPIEGAGHDYINALSETVNPANGSVSLRIQVPVSKGRGLTIPFSFGYDSDGFRHLKPGFFPNFGTVSWVSNTGYTGQGGWVYSIPQLSLDTWTGTAQVLTGYSNGEPVYQNYYCDYATAYTFRDGSGGVHALGLGARVMEQNPTPEYCLYATIPSGGDPQVGAVLTTRAYGQTTGDEYLFAPVNVYTADGTLYYFATAPLSQGSDTTQYVLPTYIEDRNGNKVTVSGSTFKDTLGRTLFSGSLGSAGHTNTVSVSGINYQLTWKSVSASYTVTSQWAGPASGPLGGAGCSPIPAVSDTQTVVSKIGLPNGQAYNFYYGNDATPHTAATNSYGLLSEIDYPSGGWVQYTWKLSDTLSELSDFPGLINGSCVNQYPCYNPTPGQDDCLYQYKTPVVSSRIVSFGGSAPSLRQTFTYSTTWNAPQNGNTLGTTWSSKSTNVTTTDSVLGKSDLTKYVYGSVVAPPVAFSNTTIPNQIAVESSTSYYDWGNTTTPLRTVNKTWANQYLLTSEQTVLNTGQSSEVTYTYGSYEQVIEKDEYNFGVTPPSPPTRKTTTTYQSFSGTIGVIADAPCKTVISDGSGVRYAEADYYYDGGTTLCGTSGTPSVQSVSGLVTGTHDETNFGSSSTTPRGNLTKKVKWASTGTSPVTTYAYDETGQVVSMTDPCGNPNGICSDMTGSSHTTIYSYANVDTNGISNYTILSGGQNVSYAPSGNVNAYVTQITDALNHATIFKYDFNNGQLTKSTDANSQSTAYLYNDSFSRPTQINNPDGGQTAFAYNDAPYNSSTPSPSITATEAITSGLNMVSTKAFDGMSHAVETILSSDPDGVDYTNMIYTGTGKTMQATNPYRGGTNTTDGTATTAYDALGRPTLVTEQDGSTVQTVYDQTCATITNALGTTVTDEAGLQRRTCTDGLGRLVEVDEPSSTGLTSPLVTLYTYDVLGNLLCVEQHATVASSTGCSAAPTSDATSQWRIRRFSYDSLSRLLSAENPETGGLAGEIVYAYDANSNLANKTAPSPNQGSPTTTVTASYAYDVLNRLTGKSYVDNYSSNPPTPPVKYGYDGVALTNCTTPPPVLADTYGIGRRTSMCDGSGATAWDHDPMGRVLMDKRLIGAITTAKNVDYGYNLDGSVSFITTPPLKSIAYTYGGAGRATQAVDNTDSIQFATSATYAPSGGLTAMTRGPATGFAGITTSNVYNNRLQPVQLYESTPSGTLFSLCYDYHNGSALTSAHCTFSASTLGNNGNVFQAINNLTTTRTQIFAYDALNRISSGQSSGTQWGETFTVDAWGNLTNETHITGKTNYEGLNVSATIQNQLTGFGYDAAGNMTSNTAIGANYVYDAENRLIWTSGNRYLYDADGKRVEKCVAGSATTACPTSGTNGTLYWRGIGSDTLDESDLSGNAVEEYIFFNGERIARRDVSTNLVHYYFSDHLGSHSKVTNATGTTCEQDIDYYPYGGVENDYCPNVAQNYKFTGKERDSESGLDNFGARYDASSMGRFMTPDPLPWLDWQHGNKEERQKFADFISDPQSLNMYAYVDNNPINKTDPTGMEGCKAGDKTFSTCTIKIVYDPKTSKGTLTVTGQNKGDKDPTVLLTSSVVVGGNGHVTPTGTFTATVWEKDHVSTKYGSAADTPYSKTILGGNAFGPYQLHMKELDSQGIYIHGTMGPSWSPTTWGNSIFLSPTSHGCVRMCNADDVKLHNIMPNPGGNKVIISAQPDPED